MQSMAQYCKNLVIVNECATQIECYVKTYSNLNMKYFLFVVKYLLYVTNHHHCYMERNIPDLNALHYFVIIY